MNRRTTLVVTALVVAAGIRAAETGPIRHRLHHQAARVHEGVEDSSLTAGEKKVLTHELRHIERARDRALSDGEVTGQEAARLMRAETRSSRHIYRLRHTQDAQE